MAFCNKVGLDKSITGEVENDPNLFKTGQAVILVILVLFPLSLVPRMSGFNYIATTSVTCLVFLIFVLIFRYPDYRKDYQEVGVHEINYFNFQFQYFSAFAGIIYAYSTQP